MSFNTIAQCAADERFGDRARAAYADADVVNADTAWYQMRWVLSADPSIEAPYASAVASDNPDPGGDESVITDAMLTAAVGAHPYPPPTLSGFGDWDPADALGHELADPEQVAIELHKLRRAEGFEAVDWDNLAPGDRGSLVQVAVVLVAWLREQGAT